MAVLSKPIARLGAALALAVAGAWPATAAPSGTPLEQALARAFPLARVESRVLALSPDEVRAVSTRARARFDARLVTAHLAWRGDTLAGTAWTDRRVIRTREAALFLTVLPDTSLERVEVLAFFEPAEYLPPPRWLGLFRRRGARQPLTPQRPVPDLAGATLSSRAVNEAARLALACFEVVLAPRLAAQGRAAGTGGSREGGQP